MARGRTTARFAHFARGLNTTDGPYALREGYADDPQGLGSEARDLLNVVPNHRGALTRRNGSYSLLSLAATPLSLSPLGAGSTSIAIAATDAGSLVSIDSGGTATTIATGKSTTAPWTWLKLPEIDPTGGALRGPYYGMNGTDSPVQVLADGTTDAAWVTNEDHVSDHLAAIPNGKYMAWWKNVLWVSGVAANPDFVYYSYVGDPSRFPTANVTKFNENDGKAITGLVSFGAYLLVFKKDGVWAVYDEQYGKNNKIHEGTGTNAPASIAAGDMGVFYLDPDQGVMLSNGATVKCISTQIQRTLDSIAHATKADASGTYRGGHYYLAIDINGVRRILDYDAALDSWWLHSPQADLLTTWDRGAGPQLVGTVGGEAWAIFESGYDTDDGTPFESWWSGPFHTFGSPLLQKRLRRVALEGSGRVEAYLSSDYGAGKGDAQGRSTMTRDSTEFGVDGTFGGDGYFGGTVTIGRDDVLTPGVARAWSLSVYSPASADDWELSGYICSVDVRRD